MYRLIIFLLVLSIRLQGQDTLYFKNKTTVVSQIVELNSTQLKYKRLDNLDGPLYVSEKKDIEYVVYKTGLKEVFDSSPNPTVANNETETKSTMSLINGNMTSAKIDANRYFKTNSMPFVIGVSAGCNIVLGLIPAVIYSSTEIKPKNLKMPNPSTKSFEYKLTYEREAEKIKRKKAWRAYGIGAGVNLSLYMAYLIIVLSQI